MKKFTIIELLIVLAIIVILTTLLIPSLSKARKSSEGAVCKSNLQQIHHGHFLYSKENNNKIVAALTILNDWNAITWDDHIGDYMSRELTWDEKKENALTLDSKVNTVFKCPSDTLTLLSEHSDQFRRTYSMNTSKNREGVAWNDSKIFISTVANDTFISGEMPKQRNRVGKDNNTKIQAPENQLDGGLLNLHGPKKFNYLFINGSVQNMYYSQGTGTGTISYAKGIWSREDGD